MSFFPAIGRRGGPRLAPWLVGGLGAAIAIALLFWGVWWWLFGPANSSSAHRVYFTVTVGESAWSVADRLTSANLLHTAWGFVWLAEHRGWGGRIRPGTYRLRASATPFSMLKTMVEGKAMNQIAVVQGSTVSLVVHRLLQLHIGTRRAYQRLERRGLPGMPARASGIRDALEGYLWPATYTIARGSTAQQALLLMWRDFQRHAKALSHHLPPNWSLKKWVTLASLIAAEVKYSSEDALVAAVFLNRLKRHMPLQSDATVYYAEGRSRRGKDLAAASPYNTYRTQGLPPGPIDNPGPRALAAALHPARVGYLYFLTGPNGRAEFANTYAQQLRHLAKLK